MSIYYLLAEFGVDTAENGPLKVCQKLLVATFVKKLKTMEASSLVVKPLGRGSRAAPAGDPAFGAVVPSGNTKLSSLRRRHRFEVEHQVTNRRLCSANFV